MATKKRTRRSNEDQTKPETTNKIYVPKHKKLTKGTLQLNRADKIPWTKKQHTLINLLTRRTKSVDIDPNYVGNLDAITTKCAFISGLAGTSKTLTAIYSALRLLNEGKISKIYYVRSAVDSSPHKIGFLPGSVDDKMGVYQSPLDDKLQELLAPEHIKLLHDGEYVKMESTCYLRGRNLSDCVVIVDESQNLTRDELVTITSRIAEQGRIWFCYDSKQSDLGRTHQKDMDNFAEIFSDTDIENRLNGFISFKFGIEDIVRSAFCKYVMTKIEEHEERTKPVSRGQQDYAKRNDFDSERKIPESIPVGVTEEWTLGDN